MDQCIYVYVLIRQLSLSGIGVSLYSAHPDHSFHGWLNLARVISKIIKINKYIKHVNKCMKKKLKKEKKNVYYWTFTSERT